jgi:hypothetical protein
VKSWIRNRIHIKDKNSRALEAQNRVVGAHNGGMEAQNRILLKSRIRIKVKIRIRISPKVKNWSRIRFLITMMRISTLASSIASQENSFVAGINFSTT